MHLFKIQLLILSLSLSLIKYVYPASRMYTSGTKYENSVYLELFRVPNNYISSLVSPGSYQNSLKSAFDDNFNTHWLSPEEGTKVKRSYYWCDVQFFKNKYYNFFYKKSFY